MEEDGSIHQFSKKVVSSLRREQRKIMRNLAGIREMSTIPGAIVIVDPGREDNAVREAKKMGLAVIGILDTDCNPEGIDIVIPGNDDALRSVRLLVESLVKAVEEGAATHREHMASMGAAERSPEETPMLDEPRPTRVRPMPRALRAIPTSGDDEDSGVLDEDLAERRPAGPRTAPAAPAVELPAE